MDQTNPLAEMTHKRRMSALGPGGLSRERAGFEVGTFTIPIMVVFVRLKPLKVLTLDLFHHLCVYAKINELGFIETPYRKVQKGQVEP
jgi:DNA-directed RNA polymerase subunit beta